MNGTGNQEGNHVLNKVAKDVEPYYILCYNKLIWIKIREDDG